MGWTLSVAQRRWQGPLALAAAAAVVLVAVVPALVATLGQLASAENALAAFTNPQLWRLLLRSLVLASTVTALTLALGVPLGILFARAKFPLQRILFAAHVSIVFLPPFLPTLGWFHLFGRAGFLGSEISASILFSELGCALVLTGCFLPIVTALTAIGARGVDASLEEAARIAGGPWRAAAFVVAPGAAPAIALAAIIVFVFAFSELGAPNFLRVDVYPALVFSRLGGMDFAPGEAAVLAAPLIALGFVLAWIEQRAAGRRSVAALGGGLRERAPLIGFRLWVFAACFVAACLSVAPIAALLAHGASSGGFADAPRWISMAPVNGVFAGALAALLMTAAAIVIGVSLVRGGGFGAWLDRTAALAFILPSAVLGVGIAFAWNHPATNWLYAGAGILVLAYVARYSALATRSFASAVAQLPRSLDDAARTMGASYFDRLALTLGLAPRAAVAAFALAFVFSLRDLETAVLLYPPGGEPLTARIFTLEANGPPGVISALAGLHILITFAALGAAWFALRTRDPA